MLKRIASTTMAAFAAALAIAGCNSSAISPTTAYIPQWRALHVAQAACPQARPGEAQCAALIGYQKAEPGVVGWEPADIEAAYSLPSASKGKRPNRCDSSMPTIIPNVASDLVEYRSYFGLPKAKFYQIQSKRAAKTLSKGRRGWGFEIDLDVDMVSAACPNCTI